MTNRNRVQILKSTAGKVGRQLQLAVMMGVCACVNISRGAAEAIVAGRATTDEEQDANWLSVGRTYCENRFSPLAEINDRSVKKLGLAWHLDLPNEGALQGTPLAVDGILYFSGSRSDVYAVDGKTGHQLW